MPTYLEAVGVQHDEPGGVDALQFDADLSREGEVVHVDGEPQVVMPRPHWPRKPRVFPWLDHLFIPSVSHPLPSAPVESSRPSGPSGTRLPSASTAIPSTAIIEANTERHGHRRNDDEGDDGQGEAQNQTLVHRDVALCGSRPDHHRLRPLVGEAAAVPHGAGAAVVESHWALNVPMETSSEKHSSTLQSDWFQMIW